jgi:hypothetical protein
MGDEYRLNFRLDSKEGVARLLETLASFHRKYELHGRTVFEFRTESSAGEMPSATAEIEDDGIYFCDYGTGAEILEELEQIVSVQFREVTKLDLSD